MKKLFLLGLMAFVAFGVIACVTDTSATTTTTTTATTSTSTTSTTTTTTTSTQTTTTTTTAPDVTAPLLLGVTDVVIFVGDSFDVNAGITAQDNVDGNITANIVVSGEYDITTPGTYYITYTITDTAGNSYYEVRELRVREAVLNTFYIVNGDFSDVLEEPWGHWAGEGGASTATIVDGVLEYNVTSVGNLTYSNQFSQVDRIVESGKIYQVSFRAKADLARPMIVQLENRTNYVKYWGTTVDLTTDWVTYEFAFEVTLASITTGKLGFFLGNIGTTSVATKVYLDDVVVTELEELPGDHTAPVMTGVGAYISELGIPFNPLQGVAVTDDYDLTISVNDIIITGTVDITTAGDYTLTYTITDESGNTAYVNRVITVSTTPPPSTFVVSNADFSVVQTTSNVTGTGDGDWIWKTDGGNTGAFTAEIVGGEAVFNITAIGTVAHGVQFYLLGRVLEQGRTYRISFDAKADLARPIKVVLENASYVRQFDHDFDVTTGWTTFTFDYYHSASTLTAGKFAFFMGLVGTTSVPTTMYLDNIVVEAIPTAVDTEAPMITGADDITISLGDSFDPLFGIDVTDNRDSSLRVVDIEITGEELIDVDTVGEYTITYSITDASGNSVTVTRVVTVTSGLAPSTLILANADFNKDQFVPVTSDGWYWKTSTGGAFTATIDNGVAQINVTNPGLVPHGVQFYQTNRVTVKDTIYIISFKAKADTPRPIKLIMENGSTYARLLDYDVFITDEWVTYTIEYNYTLDGITNAKFGFFLGAVLGTSVPTTIYIDDLQIVTAAAVNDTLAPMLIGVDDTVIVQNNTFDPMFGVKVWDFNDKVLSTTDVVVTGTVDTATPGDYVLTYSLTDASGNVLEVTRTITVVAATEFGSSFVLVNADFETEQLASVTENGWYWKTSGTGAFTASVSGGVATVNVTSLGTATYGVQFFQQNRTLESGAIYKISFKAKADIARPIQMAIEGSASSTTRLYDEIFDLTTDWETYTTTVTFPQVFGFTNGKFAFFMGLVGTTSVATTIYLDDVVIEMIGYVNDTEAPTILGATNTTVLTNDVLDLMTGISMFDIYDKELTVADIAITGAQVIDTLGVYTLDTTVAGVYDVTYTLTDQSGNETVIVRTITVQDAAPVNTFVIPNSDFAVDQAVTGIDGEWTWKTSTGGAFTLAIVNGQVEVDVTNVGLVPHGVQFNLLNRSMVSGTIYKITFAAKANDPRPIKMVIENASYVRLLDVDVYLTTEWTTYTAYVEYTGPSITNAKFAFFMGAVLNDSVPTQIFIDDITCEIVSAVVDNQAPVIYGIADAVFTQNETFNPMLGVSVWDALDKTLLSTHISVSGEVDTSTLGTYVLTYSVRDASGNVGTYTRNVEVVASVLDSSFTIVNGDFEVDQSVPYAQPAIDGWGWHGAGTFTVDISDGVAAIDVTALGTVAWGVQFYQQSRTLESGTMYKITFMAKADIARPIQLAVEGGASTTTRLWDQIFNVSTDWETYTTYVCLPKSATFVNGKFAFFMGLVGTTSVATTVYLDDVTIEAIGNVVDDSEPFIVGANDVSIAQSAVLDPLAGILVYDVYDGQLFVSDIVLTGDQITLVEGVYTFDSSATGIFTITYTLTDQSGNVVVIVRTVTVS
ncbi:MAG: carbohydrate binding domain-containing protein [Firmicutes bacterium]|nr:carbohydrate binding domain-containing protein [Bacillota bacterium]